MRSGTYSGHSSRGQITFSKFVGLDVSKDTISVAVADAGNPVQPRCGVASLRSKAFWHSAASHVMIWPRPVIYPHSKHFCNAGATYGLG